MDTTQVLEQFSDVLKINDIITFILNGIGFAVVHFLYFITSSVEGLVNKVFSLSDFFASQEVQNFISSFKPIFYSLLVGSILWLGYTFFFKPKKDRSSLMTNIFLSIVIITALPTLMIELNNISNTAINEFMPQSSSLSSSMIKENITDVLLYDENNFSVKNINPKNYLTEKTVLNIDVNEPIDPAKTNNRNIFDSKILYSAKGKTETVQLANRWYNFIWKEAYRRYNIDYLSIYIGLISLTLLFGFTIFKIARIYYELAIHQLLAILLAYGDLTGGVRLKKVLQSIFMSIFTLVFTVILLKIGIIGISYVSYHENVWVKLIFILVIAISTITGPALVEKILGVDIGSSNVAKGMATAYYTGQTMSSIGKSIGGLVGSGINGIKNVSSLINKANITRPDMSAEDTGKMSRNADYLQSAENIKLENIHGKIKKIETPTIHKLATDETSLEDNQGTVNIPTLQGLGIKGMYSKENENGLNANTKRNTLSNNKSNYSDSIRGYNAKKMPVKMDSKSRNIPVKKYNVLKDLPKHKDSKNKNKP